LSARIDDEHMGRVGPLSSACFEPSSFSTSLQQQLQQALFGMSLDQAGAKFSKDAMVEARIG